MSNGQVATNGPLLDVVDLSTHFQTQHAVVRAVDGVSFSLEQGRTLGIVGESGSGKTVLSRSVMGLLPRHNVIRRGQIRFEGQANIAQHPLIALWPSIAMFLTVLALNVAGDRLRGYFDVKEGGL